MGKIDVINDFSNDAGFWEHTKFLSSLPSLYSLLIPFFPQTDDGHERIPPGLSPIDIARRQGHGEIVKLLEDHQRKLDVEKEERHQERRDAGCMNSDSDDEDFEEKRKIAKLRERRRQEGEGGGQE